MHLFERDFRQLVAGQALFLWRVSGYERRYFAGRVAGNAGSIVDSKRMPLVSGHGFHSFTGDGEEQQKHDQDEPDQLNVLIFKDIHRIPPEQTVFSPTRVKKCRVPEK
jgi:hypothetical protein